MAKSILALLALLAFDARATSWSTFGSDHGELKGNVVLAVGVLTEERQYDLDTAERQIWHEFSDVVGPKKCLEFIGITPSILGSSAALLIADNQESVKVALVNSGMGNIQVSIEAVTIVACPGRY